MLSEERIEEILDGFRASIKPGYFVHRATYIQIVRDHITSLQKENKRLQAEVENLLELRAFMKENLELAKRRAEVIEDDRLDHIIFPLGAQMGYGAIMDSAARAWYIKDPNGSHTIGGATLVAKNLVAKTAPPDR